ncbi:hypothetical protein [Bradyrhizobium zhanjiangense]|uniref:Peptidase M15C domain-containing protein n=1 Tax=Bradyrhizobium zhanjiangense TaxID=1325107 RepID=A0ABY0DHY9_9BRAD|nr:hypothetical protein [Bradyrhizobium zhanjiangense]RXG91591.1 hypothetical protein EAS62_24235 [Bradyrhizobium zhanjiangense]
MATEQEELRLTVNLADNASAGLAKLNEEIKQLGSGASQGHVEKFKRETSELTSKIKGMTGEVGEAFKGLGMLRSGLAAGAAGLALFGFEMARQSKALVEYADKIRAVNQQARQFGVNPAQLKDVTEQLQAFGISAEESAASIGAISGKIAELQRQGSQLRLHMLQQAGPGREAVENMQRFLDRLTSAKTIADQLNIIRQGGEQVYRHALEQTHSEQEAAARRNQFYADLGYNSRLREAGQLQNLTKEEQALADQRQRNAEALSNQWGQVQKKYDTLVETLKQPFIPYLLTALKAAESVLDAIISKVNEVEEKRLLSPDKAKESIQERFGKFGLGTDNKPQGPQLRPEQEFQRRQQLDLERRRGLLGLPEKEQTDAIKKQTSATEDLTNLLKLAMAGGGAGCAAGGVIPAAYHPDGGSPFGGGGRGVSPRAFGGGGYANLGGSGGGVAPYGSDVGAGSGAGAGQTPAGPPGSSPMPPAGGGAAGVPGGSGGGSAGITAPAGFPIQRENMATVTTSSGRKFQVDQRFAANFQGFINDYEKAGGVIGPESGTLGHRPHNRSGHPIGAAIDINQVGYGIRGRGGKTLDFDTEDALAEKWGLVSGNKWSRKDTGHFGIRSPEAARQALIAQGIQVPPNGQTAGAGTGAGAGETPAGKTVKGSWFGSGPGWSDPSEPIGRKTASGQSNQVPGIALPDRSGLGKMYEVTTPDGRKFVLPQTDIGPHPRTGRGIDITSSAATQMGYTAKNFPTDARFSYRRLDEDRQQLDRAQAASTKVEGTGKISVDVNAPKGTNVAAEGGGLFKNVEIKRQTQMSEAPRGPAGGYATEQFMQ